MLIPIGDLEVSEVAQLIDSTRVAEVHHKDVFFEGAGHDDMVVEVPASGKWQCMYTQAAIGEARFI